MAWDSDDFVEALRLAAKAAGFEPGGVVPDAWTSTEPRRVRTIRISVLEREALGDYRTWAREMFPEDRFNAHNQATTAALVGLIESKGVSSLGPLSKYEESETQDWVITGTPLEDVWRLPVDNPYRQESEKVRKDLKHRTAVLWRYNRYRRHLVAGRVRKVAGALFLIVLGAVLWHLS